MKCITRAGILRGSLAALLGVAFALLSCAGVSSADEAPAFATGPTASWQLRYTSYEGYPVPHYVEGTDDKIAGWGSLPLPSYADVALVSNPAQYIVAQVVLKGLYTTPTWDYLDPTYKGSPLTLTPGTPIQLEWACQNWERVYFSFQSCNNFDPFGNCTGTQSGSSGTTYFDYKDAVVDGVVKPVVGTESLAPTHSDTYTVYCQSYPPGDHSGSNGGLGYQRGKLVDPMPIMSLSVTVDACPTSAPAAPGEPDALVLKPGATVKVLSSTGRAYCFFNPTGLSYFIPTNTGAEVNSFITSAVAGRLQDSSGNTVAYFPPSS